MAEIIVTTLEDETTENAKTSLREAIAMAQDGDTIAFADDLKEQGGLIRLTKGTELTRMVHTVLSEHDSEDFEYGGYAEGDDLFAGEFDVVVTDGFTGNVALKIAEATGRMIGRWLKGAVTKGTLAKAGALLLRPAFRDLKQMLNLFIV